MKTPITAEAIVDLVNSDVVEVGGRARRSTPLEELEIDSLVRVQLAILLERRFGVAVEEIEISRCTSFDELALLVSEKQNQQNEEPDPTAGASLV